MPETIASMDILPTELLKRIAGFLSCQDASHFSRTNTHFLNLLCMSSLPLENPLFALRCWPGATGPRRGLRIQLPLRNRVHTVFVRTSCDNFVAARNSHIYIVGNTANNSASNDNNHSGNRYRIVTQKALVDQQMSIRFNVQEDETYDLWYGAGLGSISLYNLKVRLAIFDGPGGRSISEAYSAMEQRGALRGSERAFHFRMLQGVSRTLLSQLKRGEMPDINMTSLFESFGISVSEQSMLAIDEIASSFLHFGNVCSVSEGETEDDVEVRQQLFPSAMLLPVVLPVVLTVAPPIVPPAVLLVLPPSILHAEEP